MRVAFAGRVMISASALLAGTAAAQTQRGSIAGVVRDSGGRGIAGAQLGIVSTDIRATSDSIGRYMLGGVWPGTVRVSVRRLGFTPETAAVVLASGAAVSRDFALKVMAITLAAEEVHVDPTRGKMGAFNARKARGVGSFITREEIEKRQPSSLSELLRYLPGVGVTQKMAGEPQPVHMQRSVSTTTTGACTVKLYVDGHPYENGNLDDFSPNAVEGVEVYRSAAEIPADFRNRDATCGVIAIWTRDPESARRRP